jgi:hypothetical protein
VEPSDGQHQRVPEPGVVDPSRQRRRRDGHLADVARAEAGRAREAALGARRPARAGDEPLEGGGGPRTALWQRHDDRPREHGQRAGAQAVGVHDVGVAGQRRSRRTRAGRARGGSLADVDLDVAGQVHEARGRRGGLATVT